MKNVFKVLGNLNRARRAKVPLLIIALVAVIGFSMVSCGGDDHGGGGFKLKVVNENAETITKVESLGIVWSEECNITNGNSQTFTVDALVGSYYMSVFYGSSSASNHIYTDNGETTTITLTADGKLTSDKKGGLYTE